MLYEEFLPRVRNEVECRLGAGYQTELTQVRKNNGILLDGLLIRNSNDRIMPSIYLNSYYESYQKGALFSELMEEIMKAYENAREETLHMEIPIRLGFEEVKSRIIYRMVNYEKNQLLLESIPHYQFLEYAITFHCLVRKDDEGIGSVRITEEHRKNWGVTVEDLLSVALLNTRMNFPATIRPMEDIVYEAIKQEVWTPKPEEVSLPSQYNSTMYVLTNSCGIHGASCMLYQGVLELFYEQLGTDFYILPSSIHELILVPVSEDRDKDQLEQMVKEINQTQVAIEEVLSDSVYNYESIRMLLQMLIQGKEED